MNVIYLSSKSYPSTTADGLFVARAAQAMGELLGNRFVFVVSRNDEPERFGDMQIISTGLTGRLRTLRYFFSFPKLRRHFARDTVIYSNEQPLVLVALLWRPFLGYRVVYEAHGFFNWRQDRFFLRLWRWWIDGIMATSQSLRELLEHLEPKLTGRISVVRGGYDPKATDSLPDRSAARQQLDIASDAFVVGYSGHFKTRGEKGLSTLLAALPTKATALLIGGTPDQITEYRTRFPHVVAVYKEWTSDQRMALGWLRAADVVVVPTSRDTLYTRYSFPMKVYDYLALGIPTLVADLPIIREVMTDEVAIPYRAGDGADMKKMLEILAADGGLRERLGQRARQEAGRYRWEHRARSILAALQP